MKHEETFNDVEENIFQEQELRILRDKILELANLKTLSLVDLTEEIIAKSHIGGWFRSFNFRNWKWKKGSKSWKKEPNLKNPGFKYDDKMMPHFLNITIYHNYLETKKRLGVSKIPIKNIKHNPRFVIVKSAEDYYYVKVTSYTDRVERKFFLCDDLWGITRLISDTIV